MIDLSVPYELYLDMARRVAEHNRIHNIQERNAPIITEILDFTTELYIGLAKESLYLVGNTENLSEVSFSDNFICKNCGIQLKDWVKVVPEKYEDGYVDYTEQEYEFKFCPNCGAKIKEVI